MLEGGGAVGDAPGGGLDDFGGDVWVVEDWEEKLVAEGVHGGEVVVLAI